MSKDFFPPRPDYSPKIYAYSDTNPQYSGLLKIGFTTRDVQSRVANQYPTKRPGALPYSILFEESAMRSDGSNFTDRDVHRQLRAAGIPNPDGEWFECSVEPIKAAVLAVRNSAQMDAYRSLNFKMRPEQAEAVEITANYFENFVRENVNKSPHFLWNAKMRFGKTFAAYKLAQRMGWQRVLVLTFKPAVQSAWQEDLARHVDFPGWQFCSPGGLAPENADWSKPVVCFGSFQDYLGKNKTTGGMKVKNETVHAKNWDLIVLDEYHYGAWRENAKDLFESEESKEAEFAEGQGLDLYDEGSLPITTKAFLYLSGTPFRAIASGEFIEDQIYNWTYSDEQRAKHQWEGADNPYASLPRMVLLTYQMPDSIREVAAMGEFNEFDLNEFFSAKGEGKEATFKHPDEVQKWLDLIRGGYMVTTVDNLKLGAKKPPMPFSDSRLLPVLTHTFWFLPSVAACHAMNNMLGQRQNSFFHDYRVIVAAGTQAGIGVAALPPVRKAMADPLTTKTITLSCGKLTTGVTVPPWSGIFMLRNSSTPETYFQAAFRVQSPWTISNPSGERPNEEMILKEECYVFDFAPNRALRQIADYSCRLNINESNPRNDRLSSPSVRA
ncbi:MAG: GIY-YIG nuclease family protein, partial [Chthonomonadales bacterium]